MHPVTGVVRVPGSKSATNRALILAALAEGASRLRAPLRSRDTQLMSDGLRACGTDISDAADGSGDPIDWIVDAGRVQPAPADGIRWIDCGNAGTVARFLPPAAAVLTSRPVRFDGDPRMRERPLGPLLRALTRLGAVIEDDGRGGMPFTLAAVRGLRGGEITIDASASSQLVSGLLLAAPGFDQGIVVRHEGAPIPSAPHLRMTVTMLRDSGAAVDDSRRDVWAVAPGPLRALDRVIEPDLSSASAFLAAAAATGVRWCWTGGRRAPNNPAGCCPACSRRSGAAAPSPTVD